MNKLSLAFLITIFIVLIIVSPQIVFANPPDVASGLTATQFSSTRINLAWSLGGHSAGTQNILRCTGASCTPTVVLAITDGITTAYSDTTVVASTTYGYAIQQVHGKIQGRTPIAYATTPATEVAPAAPTSLTLGSITTTSIGLTWVAPSGTVTGYKIERSLNNSSWSNATANTGTSAVTYSNTGLSSGTQYYFRVSAINAGGTGAASAASNATTSPVAPSQVTGLSATTISPTEINLSWSAPFNGGSAITGYKIERETPVGNVWSTLVTTTNSTATTYSNTGLTTNTQYNYQVSAINLIGTGNIPAKIG
ncbi:MAG: fibronectin type III domain-containing protein [Nitrosarchaeum sp.]|nr:fibronectin type III domain-containing protein [Nitrosarchaeum sp.]